MTNRVDNVLNKFSSNHSSLLCTVIIKWQQESIDSDGIIDWSNVAFLLNQKISESQERQNNILYSGIDCHRQWRFLAYGEIHNNIDTNKEMALSVEDSDEEGFYIYPFQAVNRYQHKAIPTGVSPSSTNCNPAPTLLEYSASAPSSSSTNILSSSSVRTFGSIIDSAASPVSVDLLCSTLNSTLPLPKPINEGTVRQLDKVCDLKNDNNSSSGSSSSSSYCDVVSTNGINFHANNNNDDDNLNNFCSNKNKIMSGSSHTKLLSKPARHPSRTSKLYVPSQIHSGEALMQHVVFTNSSTPFNKMSDKHSQGLCVSSAMENPAFLLHKRNVLKHTQFSSSMSSSTVQSSSINSISNGANYLKVQNNIHSNVKHGTTAADDNKNGGNDKASDSLFNPTLPPHSCSTTSNNDKRNSNSGISNSNYNNGNCAHSVDNYDNGKNRDNDGSYNKSNGTTSAVNTTNIAANSNDMNICNTVNKPIKYSNGNIQAPLQIKLMPYNFNEISEKPAKQKQKKKSNDEASIEISNVLSKGKGDNIDLPQQNKEMNHQQRLQSRELVGSIDGFPKSSSGKKNSPTYENYDGLGTDRDNHKNNIDLEADRNNQRSIIDNNSVNGNFYPDESHNTSNTSISGNNESSRSSSKVISNNVNNGISKTNEHDSISFLSDTEIYNSGNNINQSTSDRNNNIINGIYNGTVNTNLLLHDNSPGNKGIQNKNVAKECLQYTSIRTPESSEKKKKRSRELLYVNLAQKSTKKMKKDKNNANNMTSIDDDIVVPMGKDIRSLSSNDDARPKNLSVPSQPDHSFIDILVDDNDTGSAKKTIEEESGYS